jgi:hypothetical protein
MSGHGMGGTMRKARQPYEKARYAVPVGAHDAACMKSGRGEILPPIRAIAMTENQTGSKREKSRARGPALRVATAVSGDQKL